MRMNFFQMNFWFWAFVIMLCIFFLSMLFILNRFKLLLRRLEEVNRLLSARVSAPPRLRVIKGGSDPDPDERRTDE